MSNTDSFISEVDEELRRDRMKDALRRYGWIAALVVIAIVGGTAYNEYRKASVAAEAQAKGDAISNALAIADPLESAEALAAASGPESVVTGLLAAAQYELAGDTEAAVATLRAIAENPENPAIYADLASIKALLIGDADDADRALTLQFLSRAGGPYRTVALEMIALDKIATEGREAAVADLQGLLQDAETSGAQRQRLVQLITALGATPELANLPFGANDLTNGQ
ncbi:MAG: hypothetical protein AAGH17_01850 [Pseudomonadota bacterium]